MTLVQPLRFNVASWTHAGPRPQNQDRMWSKTVNHHHWLGFFAVADGLGGHLGGHVAADLACTHLEHHVEDFMAQSETACDEVARRNFSDIGRLIRARAASESECLSGMGTTLTCLTLGRTTATIYHLGDSRAYLCRDGQYKLLTEDHTVAFQLLREGSLSKADYERSPMRGRLYRYLGGRDETISKTQFPVRNGDALVLVSDGALDLGIIPKLANATYRDEFQRNVESGKFDEETRGRLRDNASILIVDLN